MPPPYAVGQSPLEALPGFAHPLIASWVSHDSFEDWLSLCLASRTMYRHYGGTLVLSVENWEHGWPVQALADLLRRHPNLKTVDIQDPRAIPALSYALAQGNLCHVRELTVEMEFTYGTTTLPVVQNLAAALRVPEALQALELLDLRPDTWHHWIGGGVPLFADVLASGAAPALRVLGLGHSLESTFQDEDLEAITTMLETRAQLPACRGLERIQTPDLLNNMCIGSEAARCQLLCALLLTVTELNLGTMSPAYAACFVAMQPPRLRKLWTINEHEYSIPVPMEVWEAMPELVEVLGDGTFWKPMDFAHLQPLIEALNRGVAFQKLQKLDLRNVKLTEEEWELLLGALAGAACASQLATLAFSRTEWPPHALATFSSMLGQDAFPLLLRLDCWNCQADDDIVVALAEGLQAAYDTRLLYLSLHHARLGDRGMAALAGVVRSGRFERLKTIDITHNVMTDEGMHLLAQAVEESGEYGLPMLLEFQAMGLRRVTSAGRQALTSALTANCPRLERGQPRVFD